MTVRNQVTIIIETDEGLIPCDIIDGCYRDPQWVGRMFGTAMRRYEDDENGRIVSFKIERAPNLQ